MSLAARAQTWLERPFDYKVQSLDRKARALAYRIYCRLRGYDFDGFIPRDQLDAKNAVSRESAGGYQAYPVQATFDLVEEALRRNGNLGCFVDVGCGKGKQCHYIAKRFDFDGKVEIGGLDRHPGSHGVSLR